MTQYLVYDVFTDAPFGGNQLAVFPDATGLPEDDLQKIAREFNFSEVTFVYPPADPAHAARVRIFTPLREVPFAGHPTIGTAIALNDLGKPGEMVLELGVGPIPCRVSPDGAAFTTTEPLDYAAEPAVPDIAACLGLATEQIKSSNHPPIQASVGLHFTFVELTDQAALAEISTNLDAFRTCEARYPTPLDYAVAAYVREGSAIALRMFAPLDDIPEDPATGSACAALAAHLSALEGQALDLSITQGVEMGRPSHIFARTAVEGGAPTSVTIVGQARRVMEGRLTYR